jgi:deoxyribodipyrimidine photolyase
MKNIGPTFHFAPAKPSQRAFIHEWDEEKYRAGYKKYPAPMINHEKTAKEALRAYRSI